MSMITARLTYVLERVGWIWNVRGRDDVRELMVGIT